MSKQLLQGDAVVWTSQAQGYVREKHGIVVSIVPAGELPSRERFLSLYKGAGCGSSRDHESYVVRVLGRGYYWPRVAALRRER